MAKELERLGSSAGKGTRLPFFFARGEGSYLEMTVRLHPQDARTRCLSLKRKGNAEIVFYILHVLILK
jgi:hypothetical protein